MSPAVVAAAKDNAIAVTVISVLVAPAVLLVLRALLDRRVGQPPRVSDEEASSTTSPPAGTTLHDRISDLSAGLGRLNEGQARLATTVTEMASQNAHDHAAVRAELANLRTTVADSIGQAHRRIDSIDGRLKAHINDDHEEST